jgi:hypothetical protein
MRIRAGGSVVALLVVLAACGGGSGSSSSVASGGQDTTLPTTETSIDGSTTSPTSTTRPAATTPPTRPRVTLPAGGPRGPVDPPNTPAYQLLTAGGTGCQQLLTAVNAWPRTSATDPSVNGVEDRLFYLYRAAAEACLLRWADAKADFDRLQKLKPAPTYGDTCSSDDVRYCERCHRLVFEWLTGQLEAFRKDPAYSPTITKSSAPSPCPSSTTSTRPTTTTTRAVATSTTLRR